MHQLLIILLTTTLLGGCAASKNGNSSSSSSAMTSQLNLDGDLIPDGEEHKYNRHPLLAELPQLWLTPKSQENPNTLRFTRPIQLLYDLNKEGETHRHDPKRKEIIRLFSNLVREGYREKHLLAEHDLTNVTPYKLFTSHEKIHFYKEVDLSNLTHIERDFEVNIKYGEGLNTISNLQASLYLIDKTTGESEEIHSDLILTDSEGTPLHLRREEKVKKVGRLTFDLSEDELEEVLSGTKSFGIQITDFEYLDYTGEMGTFQRLKARYEAQNTKITISNQHKTETFYLAPTVALKSFLESVIPEISIAEDGTLTEKDSLKVFSPKLVNPTTTGKGKWIFTGNKEDLLKSHPGKHFMIANLRSADFIRNHRSQPGRFDFDQLDAPPTILKGDILNLKIEATDFMPTVQTSNHGYEWDDYLALVPKGNLNTPLYAMAFRNRVEPGDLRRKIKRQCTYTNHKIVTQETKVTELNTDYIHHDLSITIDGTHYSLGERILNSTLKGGALYLTIASPATGSFKLSLRDQTFKGSELTGNHITGVCDNRISHGLRETPVEKRIGYSLNLTSIH